MILHTREFNVDGETVIMGRDRETGKRYLVIESTPDIILDPMQAVKPLYSVGIDDLKAIFWQV